MIFCVKHLRIKKLFAHLVLIRWRSNKNKNSAQNKKRGAFFPRKSLEMLPQPAKLRYKFSVEFRLQRVFRYNVLFSKFVFIFFFKLSILGLLKMFIFWQSFILVDNFLYDFFLKLIHCSQV